MSEPHFLSILSKTRKFDILLALFPSKMGGETGVAGVGGGALCAPTGGHPYFGSLLEPSGINRGILKPQLISIRGYATFGSFRIEPYRGGSNLGVAKALRICMVAAEIAKASVPRSFVSPVACD